MNTFNSFIWIPRHCKEILSLHQWIWWYWYRLVSSERLSVDRHSSARFTCYTVPVYTGLNTLPWVLLQLHQLSFRVWNFRKGKYESSGTARLTDHLFAVVGKQRPRKIIGVHIWSHDLTWHPSHLQKAICFQLCKESMLHVHMPCPSTNRHVVGWVDSSLVVTVRNHGNT